ncbi:hypothetical protein Hamer_G025680, partial [Homarus americanus]
LRFLKANILAKKSVSPMARVYCLYQREMIRVMLLLVLTKRQTPVLSYMLRILLTKDIVKTVDVDVVALSIRNINMTDLDELRIAYGTGKDFGYLCILYKKWRQHLVLKSSMPSPPSVQPIYRV